MTTSVTHTEHVNRGSTQSVSYEPIAIVGMGCRFPGGSNNPYAFWENLVNAKNCITPTPEDRWNSDNFFSSVKNKKAKMNTRWGGYIDGFDEFDPVFFGISPREADYMDPQQRKLLEVTWEAMEDGGLQPSMLSGRAVGVFIGGFTLDYKIMQFTNPDFSNIDAHTATGIMMTMLSNRISYIYNLNGPSLSIDTACSSSLVAVDLACRSLQQGDSEIALAGGVLLNMAPQYTISETQGGFLSPTGSSHAFSSSADGYVRSEGVGVVVLKKLSAAIADGDQIHAVIRGTAVNQDGKTNGITVPDADAQFRLMKKTYALAGVDPGKVQYIEAHGTGTPVGDPVEAESVGRLLALNRSEKDRCYIGSAKTNIGHTEAAAGMAGLIKTVMAIKHGKIPPHLHLTEINPEIDIDKHPYDIPTTLVDWPEHEGPMLAGVNSFGFGGTNAHLVLSEYIAEENKSAPHIIPDNTTTVLLDGQETIKLFPVSSRDKASLQQQARVHVQRIEQLVSEKEVDDLAYTSAHIREQHEHRATFIYRNKAELMDKMRDFIANEDMRGASLGRAKKDSDQKLVWVMTGMGPQWWAMGRQLYQREPVFKQAIDEIHEEFLRQVDWSLLDEWIYAEESASNMANTWLAQTANFALQIGLARMWRQYGPEPAAIVGHSTGEIASFYLAGVYSLKDAVAVAVHRSRLQHLTHGMGKMLAVGLTEYDVQTYITRYNGEISIAAINSPDALVLAGDEAVLNTLSAELQQREIFNRFLRVDVPYHSPVMDQIKDDLLQCLSGLQPQSATLPLYSTVTGERVYGPELDADYWWLNVRQPVLFAKTSQEMIDDGYHNFLEVGPHPVLSAAIQEVATALKTTVNVVASLHREQSEQAYFFTALASLHSMGVKLDWPTLYPDGKVVRVPTYQWRKDKYWHETPFYNRIRRGKTDHPLLGNRQVEHINSWRSDISLEKYPYLKDHSIQQQCILPAAAYIEMAYGALTQRWGNADYSLHDLSIEKGLFLKDDTDPQTTLQFDESSSSFTITSKNVMPSLSGADVASAGGSLQQSHATLHARAYVKRHYKKPSADVFDVMACQQRLDKCIDHDACYETLHHHAYHYGPGFQGIQSLWISKTELLAEIELPEHLAADNETYYFHPSLFDACLQTVIFSEILRLTEGQELISRLPVAIKEIGISANAPRRFWCHTVISQRDDEKMTADITLYDEKQQAFGRINGFIAKTVDSVASGMTSRTIDQWLYHPDWQNKTIEEEDKVDLADCYLILADDKGTGLALAQSLRQQGAHVCLATAHGKRSQPANIDDDLQSATINPSELADNVQLLQALNARYKDFGIIHCIGLDSIDVDTVDQTRLNEYKEKSIHSLLMLAKAIIQVNVGGKLWVITRNGLAIPQQTTTVDVLSASITGMSRVLAQQELVDVWGRLIDIDHGNNIDAIVNELGTLCADDEIAYRNNTRIASRLVAARDLQPPFPLRLNNNATYMVVGGFGAIGRLVCTMLVNRGARRLLITSRGSLPSRDHWQHMDPGHHLYERVQFVRSLEALGADVIVSDVDVCRERELTYFLETFAKQSYPDIRGVFFCAGIVKDAIVQNIDSRDFDDVYDTKSIGALALHRCVADYPLDHFVLFSSVAAQITTIGQTSYAAGNAFLDALCHHRHQQGLPALSINWGPWAIGMIKQLNLIEHYRSQRGISCILPEAGVKVMERILDQPHAQLTVCEANWAQVVKWYNKTPALFADLYDPADDQSDTGEGGFIDHYIQQEASDRVAFVCQNLRTVVSQVLRIDVEKVDVDLGLINLGIDSIMAAELSNRIKALFGHSLSLVKLIGEGRIIDLATELNDKIAADKEIMAAAQQTSAVTLEPVDANHSIIEAPNPFADIDVADEFPLSYGQKAIWFTHQLNPLSAAYNIGGVMHIPSQLNVEALEKAIRGVVQRHAGLRTNFFVVDGEPVQRVYASRNDNLKLVNVHGHSWQDIRQMIIAENQKPFNLENEALYRIRLYQQSNDSYYFAISIYHIISDARSNYLFLNEMQDLYARYNNNENVSIEPVASNYNDFVQSENRLINSIRGSSMYKYWRKQLPAQIPQLALPLDKKRPDVMSNNGSSFDFEIDQDLTARLKVLSRQEGATMFMALMSVYYVLLHRYTEQDDIIIGSPVAGRTSPEFADIYGYFVNPLPLWQNFSDNPTYLQLLSRVKDNTLAALENQEFPFALLVDRLELEHDPSYSLVFQAMFVLLNHQVDRSHMDDNNVAHYKGFPMQLLQMPEEEGQFDITLSVYEENGVYQCTFKYNTDLFVPGTIENMAGHFIQLLQQSLSQPQKPVNDYSMLSDLEKNKVINEFSNLNLLRQRPDQEFVPVHQQFEQQARNNPEQTAIKMSHEDDGHESLGYQQLNIRANQLAHVLIDRGIQPGTTVAIYQHKSIDMMVSLLACLKAGAAYLLLEPGQPVERLQSMLSDVSAALILHTGHDDVSAPESCFSSALLNISAVSLADMNQANPVITLNPQDCAYVVFTSGSSGQPKGVLVTHGNIHSITASWASAYRLKRTDVHCQMAAIGFDVFCGDWVRALCHGAQLVLCGKNTLLNIPSLYQTLQDNAVTIAEFVPTVLHKLMDYLVDSGQNLDFMNTIIVGSERWTIADYWRLRSLAGDKTRIINSYGTSETTVDTSFFDLGELEQPSHPEQSQTAIPIGKPFDNSCVFVLDNKMQPVATGIVGEMYIGGQGISSGYANNPEQTARCFIESPLTNELKQRDDISSLLYRTGDLVKWDHLGNLHLTGRRDSQVKIRGHRIELGEIEAIISRNDSVSRAVAAVCSDPGGQQQICVYYELRPDCQLESETLHSAAAKALPSYMIPRYYQVVTHIPELANGKTDFNNLPKPEFKRTAKQFSRPGTWYETEMADIWSDMLGVKSISLYDDFFELGGNSLYLIELTIKIQQRFTIKINVSELFRLTTLLGMACIVEDIVTGKTTGSKPYISYNDTAAKKLFSFPPAGGYSIVYKTIAEAVPEINIVSFNYLMEQDKVDRYVQMIEQIQPEGPYQLFGYSLGGNLAFEVCKCLEARGHVVENVIIMDAYCITDTVEITEKHIEEFRQELKGHLQKHTGSDIVQAHTMEQANSYIEFIYQQKNIGQTVATVHYIVEKNDNDPNRVHKLASWNDSSTNGTQVYIGACGHEDMLIGEHAGVHGKIIETILRPPVFIKRDSDLLPAQKIQAKSQNDERRVTATATSDS